MFFNRSKLNKLFSPSVKREERPFADVYGCEDIKKLFGMALESDDTCSILLTGPPASAKTLLLQCLMKLKDSHFIDCSSASKSGIVDYIFENKPKCLLLDELDKLSRKDPNLSSKPNRNRNSLRNKVQQDKKDGDKNICICYKQ